MKQITPADIAELRLIFDKGEEVPDQIELAGFRLELTETEEVATDLDEHDQPVGTQIHAFYMHPVHIFFQG